MNYKIEEKHFTEWVHGSGVDPQIVGLNVRSLSGTTPHEHLLYSDKLPRRNDGRLSTGYLRRCEHWELGGWYCNGIDLLTGDESLWGCFKPNKPRIVTKNDGFDPDPSERKQKPIKYEHPPKVQTEIFALRVPRAIAEAIADRYNIPIPEETEFWQWLIDHPEIPIVITEGAKKAGALLSAGRCAIAFPGIYNGYRQPKDEDGKKTGKAYLIPQLQVLAQPGREFYFGFDSDNKIKTITNVNKAIEKTAFLLEEQGCTCKVIEWSNEHKGVDDLIVAKGVEAFDQAYQKAKSISLWKVSRLKQLTYSVAVEIDPHLRYLPKLEIPQGVKLIGLKARKGRGKTYSIEDEVAQAIHDGRRVLVLSHRRQLVASLCDRFGLDNVNGYQTSETGGKLGYGLCTDSLRQDSQARFRPHEWIDALVIIDEVEQVLWHTLAAHTKVKDYRVEILRNLQQVIEVVLGSERGQVLVADADLSDVSLDYIRSLVDNPPEPYIIHQGYNATTITSEEKWQIYNYDHTNPKRLLADLLEHIRRGGKPFICVSAQKRKSQFGTINLETMLLEYFPSLRILRIDSETITTPEHPAYGCIERLDEVLPHYDVVLSSPSIETGVSVDHEYLNPVTSQTSPVTSNEIEVKPNLSVLQFFLMAMIKSVTSHQLPVTSERQLTVTNEQSEINNSRTLAKGEDEKTKLVRSDCSLVSVKLAIALCWLSLAPEPIIEDLPPSEFVGQKDEEAKHLGHHLKQLSVDNCGVYHRRVSDAETLSDRAFEELKRRQTRSTEERLQLHKTEICRKYEVKDVSPELVKLDEQRVYARMRLHYYGTVGRAYMKQKERKRLEKMLQLGQGCLFSPDFNRNSISAKIWVYEFLGFFPLLQKTQVHKDDPDLQQLATVSKEFAHDIKSILHVSINLDDSPVVVYRKLRQPLGLPKLIKLGRFGSRGDRHYTYANPDLTERYELFDRWLASEQPLPTEQPSPVQWAMRMLHRLESPARSFVDSTEANKFLQAIDSKLTSVVDEVEKVCSDFCPRFWEAFRLAISEV
ncbi:hypothetical protein cce_5058 [Crocosphaera subtropica ATCC 51142]|uniref:DUF3854 domain-containing protein n=1 Tax=Crocosphaera subtropica (strain ATCC 51142 / BH68) TaxID=43989 RepID=B1X2P3_CROS5|nr:plasmid replication protein, CyRepA1 family [Crocosphaera subtropica]ACB54404.1 hypothetical protein cce_5058 [Crocosphaera subtropica ATCC 51142]